MQVLRTCVLIDEMLEQERPGQAWPIVSAQVGARSAPSEVKSQDYRLPSRLAAQAQPL